MKLTLAVALLAVGCALFDTGLRDRYELSRMSGQPLPVVLRSVTTVDSNHIDFRFVHGRLSLFRGSRFELDGALEEVWDGVVRTTTHRRDRGSYEASATKITIRFTNVEGIARVFTYDKLEGGRRLRGMQSDLEVEYIKQ